MAANPIGALPAYAYLVEFQPRRGSGEAFFRLLPKNKYCCAVFAGLQGITTYSRRPRRGSGVRRFGAKETQPMIQAEIHQLFQGRACTNTILVKLSNFKVFVVILNIRSRSSNSKLLFSVSKQCIYGSGGYKTPLVQNAELRKGWIYIFFKDDDLKNEVTLKVRSRSPKSYQLFILPQWYNTLSFARIHCSIQEISYKNLKVRVTKI